MTPKVIAFDLFGTVFDLSGVDRAEIRAYIEHIKKPEWSPLVLPESWKDLPDFPDTWEGLNRLNDRYSVATMSNAPYLLQNHLLDNHALGFVKQVPLELARVYKPNPRAYLTVCDMLNVEPTEVMMVTANKDFGDLEASAALGMTPMLIRSGDGPKTIIELAEQLGC
jgi:2-haloalkanoic acid dehalogenase type II